MRQTVVGVFDKYASARHAVQVLEESGFGPDAVHVTEETDDSRFADEASAREANRDDESFTGKIRHFFADLFGPDDEQEVSHYSRAVQRGGAVVTVDVDEDGDVGRARSALESAGAMDIDEEGASADPGRARLVDDASSPPIAAVEADADEGIARTRALDEGLATDSRSARAGGIRVYPRASPGDEEAFPADDARRSTANLRADVLASVQPDIRSDTQSDLQSGQPLGAQAEMDLGRDDGDAYREDFENLHASTGERYENFEPAYLYGRGLAGEARFAGREWDDVESDARRDWEARHPDSAWDRVKSAVRHAWERARH